MEIQGEEKGGTTAPIRGQVTTGGSLSFKESCPIDASIKYWHSSTPQYRSPLYQLPGRGKRYVVYQPDLGGWNNIRMALEVVIVFAHATGRTLVLPPDAVLYLLHGNKKWGDNRSNLGDFIDVDKLRDGLNIITMQEFLKTEALPGHLLAPLPNNNVALEKKDLWAYLAKACHTRQWYPGKTFIAFNLTRGTSSPFGTLAGFDTGLGSASAEYRQHLTAFAIKRRPVLYDADFDNHVAIFFPGSSENRILTHFYGYLFFADVQIHNFYKRFVRDRMRYLDDIFCMASKVVRAVRAEAAGAPYAAYHIRRGDFQHPQMKIPSEQIVDHTQELWKPHGLVSAPGATAKPILYVSTDERNRTFFAPFESHFRIRFLSDYMSLLTTGGGGDGEVDFNHLGMVEQLVCASAALFVGTPLSTFTSYITRLRGYLNTTEVPVASGSGVGRYTSTYYFMPRQMHQLSKQPTLKLPFWPREFTEAFVGIDDTRDTCACDTYG